MTPDEFLNDKNMFLKIDTGRAYNVIIRLLTTNQAYLMSIVKRQVELQELIKGELPYNMDEAVKDKCDELQDKIDDMADKLYDDNIRDILAD
jgi:cytochrome c556